ncbi:alpha-L-rhamnosidase-related protein [Paenibacillus eucommiae]|uniref:Alpha-L-rhamnosidase n=1 Tax=Paenibacillus eucommiae TaxID=1355755 RepID=A0ABS4ITC0_9BACL|nr:family 78 glycoside hydrolase catalytic domain [Paenibacillus eucommiae]MBP1990822.1 hypothetical protein [Paenibacillus eucommiae]
MNSLNKSLWIWNQGTRDEVNQYVEFRHEFLLQERAEQAKLYLSADSDYVVWVNGVLVDYGQYDDFPNNKAYDCLSIGHLLHEGTNALCILAYYQGEGSFQYKQGYPGLIYTIETGEEVISSDIHTYCRISPSYVSGVVPKITMQLGYSFVYNANKEDLWLTNSYKMSSDWLPTKASFELNKTRPKLYERPIRKLELKERGIARIKTQGLFVRSTEQHDSSAQFMQSDYLSYRQPEYIFDKAVPSLPNLSGLQIASSTFTEASGIYLVLDLGHEECGLLELELEGEHGTIIDIACGEHLDDLRVRAEVGGRNFAVTYSCREGRQTFTHFFKRLAGRYIQLHISGVKARFVLYYAGLRPAEYPVAEKGEFYCPDRLHQQIVKTAIRTLHLCMHEHYEDTPWREQALYAMDSRNQALCGYYCFGEYDFPQASFELLGEGARQDGYLELCAPMEYEITIPSFSFLWIIELAEHLLYSGRVDFTLKMLPIIQNMMEKHIASMEGDLLKTPDESAYWNFYDWESGLAGAKGIHETRWDAPLNLFFVMGLESTAFMLQACGLIDLSAHYSSMATRVKHAIHQRFWNSDRNAYQTYQGEAYAEHYAELTQALALCTDTCPDLLAGKLRNRLASDGQDWVPITLSHSIFKFKALLGEPEAYGQLVFDCIGETWGDILFSGSTSFWETKHGADDFGRAGSLCHGWSAVPLYFYYAYLLGVQPIEPGFKVFKVNPISSGFHKATGTVPTPYGPISVKWEQKAEGLEINVNHPQGSIRQQEL